MLGRICSTEIRAGDFPATRAGVRVGADDPEEMRTRWHELELDHMVSFHPAGEHGEGIDALDLVVADRARAGEVHRCEDFEIRFV